MHHHIGVKYLPQTIFQLKQSSDMECKSVTSSLVISQSYQEVKEGSTRKGDGLVDGSVLRLAEVVYIDLRQNDLLELRSIWAHFRIKRQSAFTKKYENIILLLSIGIDEQMIKAATL